MVFRHWLSRIRPVCALSAKRATRRKKQRRLSPRTEALQSRTMLTDQLASISSAFVTEGDGSVATDVTLNAPSATQVTVDYSTSDGSAISPGDFAAAFGASHSHPVKSFRRSQCRSRTTQVSSHPMSFSRSI